MLHGKHILLVGNHWKINRILNGTREICNSGQEKSKWKRRRWFFCHFLTGSQRVHFIWRFTSSIPQILRENKHYLKGQPSSLHTVMHAQKRRSSQKASFSLETPEKTWKMHPEIIFFRCAYARTILYKAHTWWFPKWADKISVCWCVDPSHGHRRCIWISGSKVAKICFPCSMGIKFHIKIALSR